ncbi:MAG TPA: HK97-gp10 family putative phage morphogenesis protein [Alphaproteobacteria bacterium]|nr:HK97-gp10 family putative phage morphogenesis protein [Alphaproteobacteria bacterium]
MPRDPKPFRQRKSAFSFEVHGLKGLDKALRELPKSTGKSALRTALKKAAEPVAKDARSRAPRGPTGNLIESIEVKTTLKRSQLVGRAKKGDVNVYVGTAWPQGAHGHLIEFGTYKTSPRPFLRPAWDANKRKVVDSIADEIWKGLARAARRLARQAEAGKLSKSARRHFGLK